MNRNNETIDNLKKVSVSLEAGSCAETMDLVPTAHGFEFIYGLGIDGLTPFEFELAGKTAGDEISFSVRKENLRETFRHINPPFPRIPDRAHEIYIKARIDRVVRAENSEIVRSLAKVAACGDGCCGDHCSC